MTRVCGDNNNNNNNNNNQDGTGAVVALMMAWEASATTPFQCSTIPSSPLLSGEVDLVVPADGGRHRILPFTLRTPLNYSNNSSRTIWDVTNNNINNNINSIINNINNNIDITANDNAPLDHLRVGWILSIRILSSLLTVLCLEEGVGSVE